jgi:hypothetical protein
VISVQWEKFQETRKLVGNESCFGLVLPGCLNGSSIDVVIMLIKGHTSKIFATAAATFRGALATGTSTTSAAIVRVALIACAMASRYFTILSRHSLQNEADCSSTVMEGESDKGSDSAEFTRVLGCDSSPSTVSTSDEMVIFATD